MSFFDRVNAKVAAIQRIKTKYCPNCKEEMYLARWGSVWACQECDIIVDFTKEDRRAVNKFEKANGLTKTGTGAKRTKK